MDILFIIKMKISCSVNGHIGPPQICWLLNLCGLTYFEHRVQSLFDACLLYFYISIILATPNPYRSSRIVWIFAGYRIRHVYLIITWGDHEQDNIMANGLKLVQSHYDVRATSHTRLSAHNHWNSSTLIGGKGRTVPRLLHTMLDGPMVYVNARWM